MDKNATIVEKYDQQILMPLLVVVFKHLNLGNVENLTIVDESLNGGLQLL
jgi:hypothetical protein